MAIVSEGHVVCAVCPQEGPCVMTKTKVTPTMAELCRDIFAQLRHIEEAVIQRGSGKSQAPTITHAS